MRIQILNRDNWLCAYCGCDLWSETVTMDHLVPKMLGGKRTKDNLVPACSPCNNAKGDGWWDPVFSLIDPIAVAQAKTTVLSMWKIRSNQISSRLPYSSAQPKRDR